MTASNHVGVFDDVRKLPDDICDEDTVHCETEAEWIVWLDSMEGQEVTVVLDHDLGGVAFGPETSRKGVTEMVDRHLAGRLSVYQALIVTLNPAGQRWIASELQRGGIGNFVVDPGGRAIGMKAPYGW